MNDTTFIKEEKTKTKRNTSKCEVPVLDEERWAQESSEDGLGLRDDAVNRAQRGQKKFQQDHQKVCWHCKQEFNLQSALDDRKFFCSEKCESKHTWTPREQKVLQDKHPKEWLRINAEL